MNIFIISTFLLIAIYRYALLKRWFVSDETYLLGLDMVENYKNWTQGTHVWYNKDISFWTSNGSMFFKPYNSGNPFNYWELRYLEKCWKKGRKNQIIDPKGKLKELQKI